MAKNNLPNNQSIIKICSIEGCNKKVNRRTFCVKHYTRFLKFGDPFKTLRNTGEGNTYEERFWSRVIKLSSGCWEWQGCKDKDGYGSVRFKGKPTRAHIVAWYLAHGYFSEKWILHSCDNPPCCNPEHLREGTPKENQQDCVQRNRKFTMTGKANPQTKLTPRKVLKIKQNLSEGESVRGLAKRFGVSEGAIRGIKEGRTWKSI